jgi:hypothetical protein
MLINLHAITPAGHGWAFRKSGPDSLGACEIDCIYKGSGSWEGVQIRIEDSHFDCPPFNLEGTILGCPGI